MKKFQVTLQYPYTKWFEQVVEVEAEDEKGAAAAALKLERDGEEFSWFNGYEVGDGEAGDTEVFEVTELDEVEGE